MKKMILCILDGFGLSNEKNGNSVYLANTKNFDRLCKSFSFVTGNASGSFVGLPDGQMGNSEVGHLNIGSGRKVVQDLTRITNSINDKSFFNNKSLLSAIENCKKNNSPLHIMGLLSDGGVHSHIEHLYAVCQLAKINDITNVYLHVICDGRDVPPTSSKDFIIKLESYLKKEDFPGKIATICGRYYAMDRDNNYDRTKMYYDILTKNNTPIGLSPYEYIEENYKEGITDEFVKPALFCKEGIISDGSSVIFINFRPDRARQITRCFCDDDFTRFDRGDKVKVCFVCMTNYDPTIKNKLVAFEDIDIVDTLGEVLSKHGIKQLRVAETEKYAHVTFFFNGGKEVPYEGEDRILIPSPKDVKTYDEKPEMSANEVCSAVINAINDDIHKVIIVNFANPDMVGHTGNLDAAIKAIETVDNCLGKIDEALKCTKSTMIIIADHGNSEKMVDESGKPWTAHTTNKVPFVLVNYNEDLIKTRLRDNGSLCDIAPTILDIMNIDKPNSMTGSSLLI